MLVLGRELQRLRQSWGQGAAPTALSVHPHPHPNPVWTGDPGAATLPSCEIPGALLPTVGPGLGQRCLDDLETVTEKVWSCVCRTSLRLQSVIPASFYHRPPFPGLGSTP